MIFGFFKRPKKSLAQVESISEPEKGKELPLVSEVEAVSSPRKKPRKNKFKPLDEETKAENDKKIKKLRKDPTLQGQLRLAMLLQKNGLGDEGFGLLALLMAKGTPDSNWPEFMYSDHEKINDKMRLFLQREGNHELAICHHVEALLCDLRHQLDRTGRYGGLYAKEANAVIRRRTTPDALKDYLTPVLKKAGKLELMEEIRNVIEGECKRLKDFHIRRSAIYVEIEKIVCE